MNQTATRFADPSIPSSERTYALFMHLSPIAGLLIAGGMPGITIVIPLVLWFIKRNESPFLDDHGKEVVNFQISLVIYSIASGILVMACGIGIPLLIAVFVVGLVTLIRGAIAANRAEYFRSPCCIRMIK